MEVLTGQPLPAALLQSQLNSSEAAVREHALACLARAHAAGLDVTSVVASCLPRLVTSAELLSGNARRLAVDVLCSAKLSDAEWAPLAASSVAVISSEAEPAQLRHSLLGLAAGFPPTAAAAVLRHLPGLGAREPAVRCAAATAVARHCGKRHLAAALDAHAVRRLVTAAGDSHPEACAAAFTALAALCGAASGERPGMMNTATPSPTPQQCFAAATAAAEMWACAKELTARAGSLPLDLRSASVRPLSWAILGTCTGSLAAVRTAGGLAPTHAPPSRDCIAAMEALGTLLSGCCSAHVSAPGAALEAAPWLLELSQVQGAPEMYAKAACEALLALAEEGHRMAPAPVVVPTDDDKPAAAMPPPMPAMTPSNARRAALTCLAAAAPKLPLSTAPIAVRNALKCARRMSPVARAQGFAALCAGGLALCVRPDARTAAKGGALRALFGDALGALSGGAASVGADRGALQELLLALLLAATGDGEPGHACRRGAAWPLAALETLELTSGGLNLDLPSASSMDHNSTPIVHLAYIALLTKLAPTAATAGGEAAQRTRAAMRGCAASVVRRCLAIQERIAVPRPSSGDTTAAASFAHVAAACAAVLASSGGQAQEAAAADVRTFAEVISCAVQLSVAALKARDSAQQHAALHDGSLITAAAASADEMSSVVTASLHVAVRSCISFLALCPGVEARMDAATQLKRALVPLTEGTGGASSAVEVADALADVKVDTESAEHGEPPVDGLSAGAASAHPQFVVPPTTLLNTHDVQLRACVVAALASAGVHLDDAASRPRHANHNTGVVSCVQPCVPVVVTAGSDPYRVTLRHESSPQATTLTIHVHITNVAASPPSSDLGLTLALTGPLLTPDGSAAVRIDPLALQPPGAASAATDADPGSSRALTAATGPGELHFSRSVDLGVCAFGPACVHAALSMSDRQGDSTLRCASYRIPLIHLLAPCRGNMSLSTFFDAWHALPAGCTALVAPPADTTLPFSLSQPQQRRSALAALVSACDACCPPWTRVVATAVPDVDSGLPDGAGRAAYAAVTWQGHLVLVLATSAPGRCAHVETRSPAGDVVAAVAADLEGWVSDLTGGASERVVSDAGAVHDDDDVFARAASDAEVSDGEEQHAHGQAGGADVMLFSPFK